MKRREFIAGTAVLIGAACTSIVTAWDESAVDGAQFGNDARNNSAADNAARHDGKSDVAADDVELVKQAIAKYYSTFFVDFDKQTYRSLLTEDYLLLENGELFDVEGDIATMPAPDSGYKRTDSFDYRSVKVHSDIAYAVYFLKSKTTDKKNGTRNREWLESAILRRSGSSWRIALLHSTRIAK